MSINWPRFIEVIRSHQRFLLVSHIRPDCDALGSELGMAGILDALGKQVRIVNGQATPPNYQFIDPQKRIKAINVDVQPADLDDVEVLMVLDTSAWAQLGPMADVVRATKAKKIVLDHPMSSDDLGAELFKDVQAEATGRSQQELIREAVDRYLGLASEAVPRTAAGALLSSGTVLSARSEFRESDELLALPEGLGTLELLDRDDRV
jgi:nanoRNase/pAp phosphatase (c-di-AMP/oligoRNAs hydrolase)